LWGLPPGSSIAASDHPVNEACDNARARHDLQMPPHNAVEAHGVGVERDEAEIAGKPDATAAYRIAAMISAGRNAKPETKMKPKPTTISIAL
jgi:hypothetical protein